MKREAALLLACSRLIVLRRGNIIVSIVRYLGWWTAPT
jgi:hypothetical protein